MSANNITTANFLTLNFRDTANDQLEEKVMTTNKKMSEKTMQASNWPEGFTRLEIYGKNGEVLDVTLMKVINGEWQAMGSWANCQEELDYWSDEEITLVQKFAKVAAKVADAIHPPFVSSIIVDEVNAS
jgi:hypothetical protein